MILLGEERAQIFRASNLGPYIYEIRASSPSEPWKTYSGRSSPNFYETYLENIILNNVDQGLVLFLQALKHDDIEN